MTQAAQDADFQNRMRQLEGLLHDVDAIPDALARAKTAQVIQGLMDFHGAGLRTIFHHLAESGDAARPIIDALSRDDLVGSLLLLYGLHPLDLESRVRLALDKVRPYLASHGGSVQLLRISPDGVVHLRMEGNCHGCPSSAATLKSTIEQAILEKAPDAASIQVEGVTEPPTPQPNGFVPIEHLTRRIGSAPQTDFSPFPVGPAVPAASSLLPSPGTPPFFIPSPGTPGEGQGEGSAPHPHIHPQPTLTQGAHTHVL